MQDELEALWGDEFVPEAKKEKTKKILQKIAKPKSEKAPTEKTVSKQLKSKTIDIDTQLSLITSEVLRVLGKQKENIVVIKDYDSYISYLNECIKVGRIDIDTETNNSLDPITCKLMGLCLYYPGGKQAYIPVNHRDPHTKVRLDWQLTEEQIAEGLKQFKEQRPVYNSLEYPQSYGEWYDEVIYPFLEKQYTKVVLHNGKFDYQVLKCTCGVEVPMDWDTLIAEKLIDENQFTYNLKNLYIAKIDPEQEKYSIDHLFEGVEYADVDPEIFAYYAATDSMMTDKLMQYQLPIMLLPDNEKIYKLFRQVEMPLVEVIAEMEMAGMEVDQEYGKRLSDKFHKRLDNVDKRLSEILENLEGRIDDWRLTPDALDAQKKKQSEKQRASALKSANYDDSLWSFSNGSWYKVSKSKNDQLDEVLTPDSLASPTQLGILLYSILKCPVVNEEKPTATGEDELKSIKAYAEKKNDIVIKEICELILSRRELVKLLSTYIDNIPELAKRWPDGRVRTHFNQYGAQTGRLSSSDPLNFQNIPSHEKSIRMLFKAKDGYRIIGADYSAQEPRLVAHYSQDQNMLDAYLNKRDLYSVIASQSFNYPYEECLEFYPEGTEIEFEGNKVICGYKTHQNKDGKGRRTMAKSILLGILYGRGAASVGEQIGKTREEAQEILDKFFGAFPTVKTWIEESQNGCRANGWVEDVAGRRRRLPDIKLPKYTIKYKNKDLATDFIPFLGCTNIAGEDNLIKSYREQLEKIKSPKQYESIKSKAATDGIDISNNGGFIAQAERQCVNARVQGGAATLTKCALNKIYRDQRLIQLGARLVNTVHDEILIEAPKEVSEQASEFLCDDMISSAKVWVPVVPMASDAYNVDMWYSDEYQVLLENEYKHLVEGDAKKGIEPISAELAEKKVIENHSELLDWQIKDAIHLQDLHL